MPAGVVPEVMYATGASSLAAASTAGLMTDKAVSASIMREVALEAATLDPEDALPMFEEMAAVAAALQGRLEGPYR
jgi:hypothetical protein